MLYVRVDDLEPDSPARRQGPHAGRVQGHELPARRREHPCPVRLKRNAEPLVLRATAGDCVTLTLYNRLPATAPDLPTLATLIGAVKRDRNGPDGSVPFDNNLIRASSHVGVTPQLVAVDVQSYLGTNVGTNVTQTVPPVDAAGKTGQGRVHLVRR